MSAFYLAAVARLPLYVAIEDRCDLLKCWWGISSRSGWLVRAPGGANEGKRKENVKTKENFCQEPG